MPSGASGVRRANAASPTAPSGAVFPLEIGAILWLGTKSWQIAEYLEKAGWTEPFDPTLYDEDDDDFDAEEIEMERKDNIRRVAREMLLIEQAKEWLLGQDGE